MPKPDPDATKPRIWEEQTKHGEILRAAAMLFFEKGYEATTTRDIATLAKTSKRTVYAEFPSKEMILRALISGSTAEITEAIDLELPATREDLLATLRAFAGHFLRLVLEQRRLSMTRLAIAESLRSPEIGKEIESLGRHKVSASVERVLRHAAAQGLMHGRDIELMMNAYFYVLLGNLQIGILLGTEPPPSKATLAKRVDIAMRIVERLVAPQ
jgi:AcrR family transcriptional regulator